MGLMVPEKVMVGFAKKKKVKVGHVYKLGESSSMKA